MVYSFYIHGVVEKLVWIMWRVKWIEPICIFSQTNLFTFILFLALLLLLSISRICNYVYWNIVKYKQHLLIGYYYDHQNVIPLVESHPRHVHRLVIIALQQTPSWLAHFLRNWFHFVPFPSAFEFTLRTHDKHFFLVYISKCVQTNVIYVKTLNLILSASNYISPNNSLHIPHV